MSSPSLEPPVSASPVLLVGDPRLRVRSAEVRGPGDTRLGAVMAQLVATLRDFRARHGFGRAIAAPQIGVARRLVALDLGRGPRVLVNPRIVSASAETFTLWDDCLSFPELHVRVRRTRSISLEFEDERGHTERWSDLEPSAAELFQHEIDHLDGILALDRALDKESIVHRAVFAAQRERFQALVDGCGSPTPS